MNRVVHEDFKKYMTYFDDFIVHFDSKGEPFGNQNRNSLKLFEIDYLQINIKSFKIPNFINKVVYKFFRKGKAQRSFEYAKKLQELGFGTPQPMAYYEFTTPFLFKKSYYLSEHLPYDLTYRELTHDFNYPDHEKILRAFTRFTYYLHESNINFLDHSPGNTLIRKNGNNYDFYLVDLNRMKFEIMDLDARLKNFARLTFHKSLVEIMSDEYAKCINRPKDVIFPLMWYYTEEFHRKFNRKKRLKKVLKFWK